MLWWRHSAGVLEAWAGFPAWEEIHCPCGAMQNPTGVPALVSVGNWQGHSYSPSSPWHRLGHITGTVTHPRRAQAAAVWVHAAYSTDTCCMWSMRLITCRQGHTSNMLISGAIVQRSIDPRCSGHSWHTINMYSVSQANWGLQRLSVIFTSGMHSFTPPLPSLLLSFLTLRPLGNLWHGGVSMCAMRFYCSLLLSCTLCCYPAL